MDTQVLSMRVPTELAREVRLLATLNGSKYRQDFLVEAVQRAINESPQLETAKRLLKEMREEQPNES